MPDGTSQRQFESLLAPLVGSAFGVALRLTGNRDDAEDLVQEASLLAFRAFGSFAPGTNFKAWFFKILTNRFYQWCRKHRREPEIASVEDAPEIYLYTQTRKAGLHEGGGDPAELVLGKLDEEQVGAAIASLPDDFRVAATLYFMEQLSYQEIADILECPVGTIRSRLHRGRRILQKALWEIAVANGIVEPGEAEE